VWLTRRVWRVTYAAHAVTRRLLSQVRRREAEEHARRMNLLFPSAAAAAEDLPPPPPKVWQRDKDQQESLLASKMIETSESELI
jgi:hypothetical protein